MNVVVAGRVSTSPDVMVVVWVVPVWDEVVDVVDAVCAAAPVAMPNVNAAAINTRFNIRTSASNSL
jgi:hypothetical protein